MATGLYVKGKQNLGVQNIDLLGGNIIAILVDTSVYSADLSNDSVQADIPSSAIIAERTLTGKSFTNGIFDADDLSFPSLESDQEVGAIVLAQDSNAASTSLLVAYIDSVPQFPVTPDGTDFTIIWDNGPNKIFVL